MRRFGNKIQIFIKNDFYGFLGFLFWGYFLLLSLVLFKECNLNYDNASEITWILNGKGINPVFFRWGALPYRIFLILGLYFDISLLTILILNSFWFIFLKFIGWIICHYYFKNTYAGLLVLFSVLLSGSEGFYAQSLQVYNATLYFSLLYAVLTDTNFRIKSDWVLYSIILVLLIFIEGTHVGIFLTTPLLIYVYI